MGIVRMGPVPFASKKGIDYIPKAVKAATFQPIETKAELVVEPIEVKPLVEKTVEKQVFIEVPMKDSKMRKHSLLVSEKVAGLSQGMDELLISQKRDKSELQMQLSDLRDQVRKIANSSAKTQIDLSEQLKKISSDLEMVAAHKPNVTEIRHIETRKVSKLLVFLNILLLGSVLVLLCK